jgi:cytochrome c oxidase cbb3-type subunit III
MTTSARLIATVVLAGAWTTGFVLAQTPATPAPQTPQTQTPPPQQPAPAAPARGRIDAPAGQRSGGFTQFTRPIASQDVLVRGKALYDTNCASCHASDLRGTADGKNPNLLRSGVALRDQHGELIAARLAKHTPPITLIQTDSTAIAEYIHSIHATMSGQGSPPGRFPQNLNLDILVGDPKAGQAAFAAVCGACHSVTGDLKGIATKLQEPRALQNGWVSGSTGTFGGRGGGGRGGGGGGGVPAVVTLADGSKLEGTLLRADDFLIVLMLPDGTRKSMARNNGVPKVEEKDPRQGHVDAIVKLAHEDTTSKMMHDITAYLWTIK